MSRIKGILALKQRRALEESVSAAEKLVLDETLSEGLRGLVTATLGVQICFAKFLLYIDDCKIIEKTISKRDTGCAGAGT